MSPAFLGVADNRPPVGNSEWIPWCSLLVHTAFAFPSKLSWSQPWVLALLPFHFFSPSHLRQVSEWLGGAVLPDGLNPKVLIFWCSFQELSIHCILRLSKIALVKINCSCSSVTRLDGQVDTKKLQLKILSIREDTVTEGLDYLFNASLIPLSLMNSCWRFQSVRYFTHPVGRCPLRISLSVYNYFASHIWLV